MSHLTAGMLTVWKIYPLDPEATDDEDALFRHFAGCNLNEATMMALMMGTQLGDLILGTVRYTGIPTGRGSLGRWRESRWKTKSGRLSPGSTRRRCIEHPADAKGASASQQRIRLMSSDAIKSVVRWLKGIRLALVWSRMTPDQINEWLSSDERQAEVDALFLPEPDAVDGELPKWRRRGEPRR